MHNSELSYLKELAKTYIWWKDANEAIKWPERVVAQVMNMGAYEDVCALQKMLGADYFKKVLIGAEAGQFNERSWTYWHYKLNLAELDQVPPLPIRKID